MNEQPLDTRKAVEELSEIFRHYPPANPKDFCTLCYDEREIAYITNTSVLDLDIDTTIKLLWETGDHWESKQFYKHYLPRILEILAPPHSCEDIYPKHLFGVLEYFEFKTWPTREQATVISFLQLITPHMCYFDTEEQQEWLEGIESMAL